MKSLIRFCCVITILVLATVTVGHAETLEKNGYIIHYSAFNTSFIQPDVAKLYNINRSRYRGLINIAVHRKMKDGSSKPVIAKLSGYARRLSGSESPLEFQLISEGKAIYYLAETIIGNNETLRFDIKIQPTPQLPPIKLAFKQTFFIDEES